MHDSLGYMAHDPVHRQYHHHQMTFSMMYAYAENYVLPLSHDEVVHGKGSLLRKMPGDRWRQLANLRAYLAFMWAHPGKQLIFMGIELAQESEWAEGRELDWWLLDHIEHRGVHDLVGDLNRRYARPRRCGRRIRTRPASAGSTPTTAPTTSSRSCAPAATAGRWRACPTSRRSRTTTTGSDCPHAGTWREVVNTDADAYYGSGVGNLGAVEARRGGVARPPASATVQLPPLGTDLARTRPNPRR